MELFRLILTKVSEKNIFRATAGERTVDVELRWDSTVSSTLERLRLPSSHPNAFLNFSLHEEACTQVGDNLFTAFFREGVLSSFEEYLERNKLSKTDPRGHRIGIYIPDSLHWAPWELLRRPDSKPGYFFSLWGSVIRFQTEAREILRTDFEAEAQCLFVHSESGPDRPIPSLEWQGGGRIKVTRVKPPTLEALVKSGQCPKENYKMLVFYGHGDVDNRGAGQLVFSERGPGKLRSSREVMQSYYAVAHSCAEIGTLRLVILGACCTSLQQMGHSRFSTTVVGALIERTDVDYVLGCQGSIHPKALHLFLNGMLGTLSSKQARATLDDALRAGRVACRNVPGDGSESLFVHDWWLPVLYSDSPVTDFFGKRLNFYGSTVTPWSSGLAQTDLDTLAPHQRI